MLTYVILAGAISLVGLAFLAASWRKIWNRVQNGGDERGKLRAEFLKTMLQAAGVIAVLPSVVLSLAAYRNQLDKDRLDSEQKAQTQSSEQFRAAVLLLQDQTLGSTEAGVVLLGLVTRFDPARYTCPTRSVLKAKLMELQTGTTRYVDWTDDSSALRYRPMLEQYQATYSSGPTGYACDAPHRESTDLTSRRDPVKNSVDLSFLRVRKFSPITNEGILASYRTAVLTDADFSGYDLAQVNFDRANLEGSVFVGADLSGASFRGANLRGASFVGARLANADFDSATMIGARLSGSNLTCANLRGADLSDTSAGVDDLAWAKLYPETVLPSTICAKSQVDCNGRLVDYRRKELVKFHSRASAAAASSSRYWLADHCDYP